MALGVNIGTTDTTPHDNGARPNYDYVIVDGMLCYPVWSEDKKQWVYRGERTRPRPPKRYTTDYPE